eukprot:6677136-Prymnesium_polylepis.1
MVVTAAGRATVSCNTHGSAPSLLEDRPPCTHRKTRSRSSPPTASTYTPQRQSNRIAFPAHTCGVEMRATAWKVAAELAVLGATVAEGFGAEQEWAAAVKEAAAMAGSK